MSNAKVDAFLERAKNWRAEFEALRAIIAAYDNADPVARDALDNVAETLNAVLSETRGVVLRNMATPDTAAVLALRAADWLKPLIARMAAVINGTATAPVGADTQSAIDEIFNQ